MPCSHGTIMNKGYINLTSINLKISSMTEKYTINTSMTVAMKWNFTVLEGTEQGVLA